MRKSELIRLNDALIKEHEEFRSELKTLRDKLYKYKNILKTTRDRYGEKLMELEQKRLLLEHPDILVEGIEWEPVEDYDSFTRAKYKFIYSIKGER